MPPTFTHNNKLYQAPKSALLRRFKTAPYTTAPTPAADATQLIVDLSMVTKVQVSVLNIDHTTTFKDFFDQVWRYINNKHYTRIDVVGDNYETPHILKNSTREDRGTGTTVNFDIDSTLPSNFKKDFSSVL